MSGSSSDESRGPSPVPSLASRQQAHRQRSATETQQPPPPVSPQASLSPSKESTKANSESSSMPSLAEPPLLSEAHQLPQPQRQASQSRHRGRSRARRSPSVASTISDAGPEEIFPDADKRRKRKNKKRQQQKPLPVVNEVETTGKEVVETAGGAVQGVTDTTKAVTQAASPSGGGSDKPLKLRLDLNLDADIRLTAKIHGDITLSLLWVPMQFVPISRRGSLNWDKALKQLNLLLLECYDRPPPKDAISFVLVSLDVEILRSTVQKGNLDWTIDFILCLQKEFFSLTLAII